MSTPMTVDARSALDTSEQPGMPHNMASLRQLTAITGGGDHDPA